VRGKAAVAIVTRHELLATDRRSARLASRAHSAGNHSRNNHGSPQPGTRILARSDDPAGDFVSQNEGKRMTGRDIAAGEGNIRVTDAAACDLYNHVIRAGIERCEIAGLQSSSRSGELKSMCPSHACHRNLSPPVILGTV